MAEMKQRAKRPYYMKARCARMLAVTSWLSAHRAKTRQFLMSEQERVISLPSAAWRAMLMIVSLQGRKIFGASACHASEQNYWLIVLARSGKGSIGAASFV